MHDEESSKPTLIQRSSEIKYKYFFLTESKEQN